MEKALYLIPVGLSDVNPEYVVPEKNVEIMRNLKYFVVENLRSARRWIKKCCPDFAFDGVEMRELSEHTPLDEVESMLDPIREGHSIGVMSEAGCPAVADPGADIVAAAQKIGVKIVPLVGPSSILMSLMASGFNGQSFCFNGYLPIEDKERIRRLHLLERESESENRTQIFIETPYRNNKLLALMTEVLSKDTLVCVASDITDPDKESIRTMSVGLWARQKYDFSKRPAIFLIYREGGKDNGNATFKGKRRKK